MPDDMLLYLGVALVLISIVYLSLGSSQRDVILSRLSFRRRRTSGSATPPQSFTPDKKGAVVQDWREVFPPSRRASLAQVPAFTEEQKKILKVSPPSPGQIKQAIAPLMTPLEDLTSPAYTPTEFSTEDIKALGDFPDYAQLSGVPLPEPYHEFDISKAKPRPYRPFRWPYHQTMSLTKLQTDWWLELESNYAERIGQRKDLYRKNGKAVLNYLPGSELACKELMEMSLQFLCARYPQYFSISPTKDVFHNGILHTRTRIKDHHPLHVLLDNVPEDFAIMLRDPTNGFYYFRAGIICSALGWNVESKIGLQLHQIHAPIPDYKEKMQFSMDRYFSKLPTDRPIQRGSWGLEVDTPLYMPPGDPHEAHRSVQQPELELSRIHLRVDWQTLRRLPLSAAIVFNFKALFTPITEFADEAYIPALCNKVLKEGKKNLMEYKNTWHVEHVAIPALEEYEREQVEKGMVEEGWDVHTLRESPWYPGWEEKWHAQQGF
ncbi:MAG: hypothetical protein M1833_002426 [Piccolia ochrophora]|nr:MAG: hypothetical protein M1833_002426 [Piccolia ochrophora]